MDIQELAKLHAEVSMEFSNPFAKLNASGLTALRNFVAGATRFTNDLFRDVDKTHPNGLLGRTEDIPQKVKEQKVVYTDWGYLTTYCPSFMKMGVQMIDLGAYLEESLDVSVMINRAAPQQVISILQAYLGKLDRLDDPIAATVPVESGMSLIELTKLTDQLKAKGRSLITSTGSSTEREYRTMYRRNEDYYKANEIAGKCNKHYGDLTYTLKAYMEQCDQANETAALLLKRISDNPELRVNPVTAKYLTDVMFQLGNLTAWFASSLYNAQYYLKSMVDTNDKIRRVLS